MINSSEKYLAVLPSDVFVFPSSLINGAQNNKASNGSVHCTFSDTSTIAINNSNTYINNSTRLNEQDNCLIRRATRTDTTSTVDSHRNEIGSNNLQFEIPVLDFDDEQAASCNFFQFQMISPIGCKNRRQWYFHEVLHEDVGYEGPLELDDSINPARGVNRKRKLNEMKCKVQKMASRGASKQFNSSVMNLNEVSAVIQSNTRACDNNTLSIHTINSFNEKEDISSPHYTYESNCFHYPEPNHMQLFDNSYYHGFTDRSMIQFNSTSCNTGNNVTDELESYVEKEGQETVDRLVSILSSTCETSIKLAAVEKAEERNLGKNFVQVSESTTSKTVSEVRLPSANLLLKLLDQ